MDVNCKKETESYLGDLDVTMPASWRLFAEVFAWTDKHAAELVVFMFTLLAKIIMVFKFAPRLLCLDQWDGVVSKMLVPLVNHLWSYAGLFEPYNEHRMVFQHVYDMALFTFFGHYDNRTWCVCNAIFHAAILSLLCLLLIKVAKQGRWWIALACGLVGVLPFASENTLCGFQSQAYWMLFFTILSGWFLVAGGSQRRWNLGWALALCSVFTLASGFLIAACAVPFEKRWDRKIALLGIVALGLWLKFGFPSYLSYPEAYMKEPAENAGAFVLATSRALAWPDVFHPWLCVVTLLPLLWFRRLPVFVNIMLLWVVLQAVAMGYARGTGGRWPLTRYHDYLCLLLPLGTVAWIMLKDKAAWRGAWIVTMASGLVTLTIFNLASELPGRVQLEGMWDTNTLALYHLGDPRLFAGKPSWVLPWPKGAEDFNSLIHNPDIQRVVNLK